MIKFENTDIYGLEAAIRGMRNPMNSWDKSDSSSCGTCGDCDICVDYNNCPYDHGGNKYLIGPNDLDLMKRLIKAGSDHRKFMRMINVTVDITAPLYWWKEFDVYKVGTVSNSCSTMHKIADKEFTLKDFSCEHLFYDEDDTLNECYNYSGCLEHIINGLNSARNHFLETKDKKYWWQMIQLLPSSYNQKRTIGMNYENLRNMYHARKNHKLDEWSIGFCDWVKTLPYSELITE